MSFVSRLSYLIASFFTDRRAAIAPTFALMIIPILGGMGFAVDLSMMLAEKTRAQNIADSGAIDALRVVETYMSANGDTQSIFNSIEPTAVQNGASFMNGLATKDSNMISPVPTVTITYTNQVITVKSNLSFTFSPAFMGIFGINSVNEVVVSAATQTLPQYLDFYLMLDMSGSMGFPSTTGEQTRLAQQQIALGSNGDFTSQYPTGCTFACHFPGYQGYNLSRTNGTSNPPVTSCATTGLSNCIQLRTDAVGIAITQLLSTRRTVSS